MSVQIELFQILFFFLTDDFIAIGQCKCFHLYNYRLVPQNLRSCLVIDFIFLIVFLWVSFSDNSLEKPYGG